MTAKKAAAILGGGVGGLSAAHELAERGSAVTVYERNAAFGGKAGSVSVAGSDIGGRTDLPGEHGFRFFPGFYKHDRAGEADPSLAAASVLLGAQRTAVVRAIALQLAVSLVCRIGAR